MNMCQERVVCIKSFADISDGLTGVCTADLKDGTNNVFAVLFDKKIRGYNWNWITMENEYKKYFILERESNIQ